MRRCLEREAGHSLSGRLVRFFSGRLGRLVGSFSFVLINATGLVIRRRAGPVFAFVEFLGASLLSPSLAGVLLLPACCCWSRREGTTVGGASSRRAGARRQMRLARRGPVGRGGSREWKGPIRPARPKRVHVSTTQTPAPTATTTAAKRILRIIATRMHYGHDIPRK